MLRKYAKITLDDCMRLRINHCICGGEPEMIMTPLSYVWFCRCTNCGKDTHVHISLEQAIREWNEMQELNDNSGMDASKGTALAFKESL